MPAKTPAPHSVGKLMSHLAALMLLAMLSTSAGFASTLYYDSFENYPAQNPAPNPLTNGPAGGQWTYLDQTPPLTVNEHRILNTFTTGAGLNSKCWYTLTNNAALTNAISLAGLPGGTNVHTFHLSFIIAADTLTATRNITFEYGISSSGGSLTFLSGNNMDNSQTFSGLTGTGIASAGSIGKTLDRQFVITFQGSNLTSSDKIFLEFERITNNAGAVVAMLMDDVRLTVDDNGKPVVSSIVPVPSLQHVRVSFSELLDPASATNIANYSLSPAPLNLQGVRLIDSTTVELYTSDQTPGANYSAQISGVMSQSGISMVATQLNFTTPAMSISPIRYDAGTTSSQPSGPADPASASGGFWTQLINTNPGMTVGPVTDDLGTGLNAWNVTDQNVLASGGSLNYTLPIDQASDNFARSNGWRMVLRSRVVDNFGSVAPDQIISYSDNSLSWRYGLFYGVNGNGNLFVTVLGGNTYELTSDVYSYHTHVLAYDPVTASASYYFDGQLIVTNYPGQSVAGVNGFSFGSANSTGAGSMNYNLVQFDVVGAHQPVVTLNPPNTTNGVGQKVTFTAGFTPFVNAYQWLSNNVIIPGATANTYTTDFITSGYDGAQYRCRALSSFGNVETAAAVLTVTSDTNRPFVTSIRGSLTTDRVRITFSEPILEAYATNIANYVWSGGATTLSAIMIDPFTVELRAGPFVAGNSYTVQVSNVRDTSNLIITPNSPSTVLMPQQVSLYRYDAGNTTNAPSGPPDPTTPQGGNWTLRLDVDDNISTNAIIDDNGTGLNAWQVRDASTATARFVHYSQPVAQDLYANLFNAGWMLTIRARLPESFGSSVALFAQFADVNNNRYGLSFQADVFNNYIVGTSAGNAFVNRTVLDDGTALNDYHTHQIVYYPGSGNASYYFDGNLVYGGWPYSNTGVSTTPGLLWGALSSAGQGTMNVNLIELSSAPFPFARLAVTNGNNLQISYRGVLESATSLQTPITWTPVATNSTIGTNFYSDSTIGQPQRYYRARMLQ